MRVLHILLCVLALALTVRAAERPNIILCMADDQGWGDMAYNGHPVLKTPTFDSLARTGLRLDRFYAAAPVCSPTRASVMTGRTPNRSGVFCWGHTLRPQEVTVGEAVKTAGYATGHFGKWHLGSVLAGFDTTPGAQGFDRWLSAQNFYDNDSWLSDQGKPVKMQGESSQLAVDAAISFAKEQVAKKKPFLAVVWFGSPHAPHIGTAEDLALYADQPKKQQHFLAEITAMDRAMGKLRAAIKDLGIANNTVLWYCSDNGAIPEGSTGGLRGKKGQIYEGGLRVPCLIEWPGHIQPRRSDLPASTMDIYPTVLELAGAKVAKQPVLDGESLVGLFDGRMTSRTKPIGFWDNEERGFSTPSDKLLADAAEMLKANQPIPPDHPSRGKAPAPFAWTEPDGVYRGHAAWLDGNWKLHRIDGKKSKGQLVWELYDLGADPQESKDLASQQPQRVAAMKAQLEAWLKSVTNSLRGQDY